MLNGEVFLFVCVLTIHDSMIGTTYDDIRIAQRKLFQRRVADLDHRQTWGSIRRIRLWRPCLSICGMAIASPTKVVLRQGSPNKGQTGRHIYIWKLHLVVFASFQNMKFSITILYMCILYVYTSFLSISQKFLIIL